jgi:hypothetical protein
LSVPTPTVVLVSVITEDFPAPTEEVVLPDLGALGPVLERYAAVVEELAGFDPTVLSDEAVELAIQRYVTTDRAAAAGRNGLVFEALMRALPMVRRFRSPGMYLRDLVRCSAAEGNAWVREAEALTPVPPVSGGDPIPPACPETARAVADGAIGAAHVRHILATMRLMPGSVGPVQRGGWEALLAGQARTLDPDQLDVACKHVLAGIDDDRDEDAKEHERQRRRGLSIGRQGVDGMTPVKGLLTPMAAGLLRSALNPLAAPQPTKDAADLRTAAQRNHDALEELCRRYLTVGDLPTRHGHTTTMLVTIRLEDLENRTGIASVAHGGTISVRELIRRAAEASVIPVVLDSDGRVLHYGQEKRLADEHQRRALIVTDIGCTWPGCDVPGVWCACAHCTPFRISKRTSIDDMGLLCGYHHDYADTHDWTMQRRNNRVWFTPPKWIDPKQTPRTNEYFTPHRT